MKSYFYLLMAVLIMTAGVTGCKSSKNSVQIAQKEEVRTASSFDEANLVVQKPRVMALPSVIIYKTKADYSKNVPIGLNEEKTSIVSYPGQTDLKDQEPIPLKHGFLLDKRGVNLNSAFLKYTYAEFLALDAIPPIAELFNAIIDADPFTEMYDCGKISEFNNGNLEEQLNQALMESNGNPETIYKRLK